MAQGVVASLVVAVLAVACSSAGEPDPAPTTTTPSPTATAAPITGPRVAVVLPAADVSAPARATADAQAVDRIRSSYSDRLSEVRGVTPDEDDFTADVVGLLAEQEYALVCAVGSAATSAVLEVAPDYPRTRFCVVPAPPAGEVPPNVLLIDLAVEEPAYVAGAVAVRLAPGDPPGFVGSRAEYAVDRRRGAFESGASASIPEGTEPVAPLVGVATGDPDAAELARAQFDAEASVVYSAAAAEDAGALAVAAEVGGGLIGSAATLLADETEDEDDPPPAVLLGVEERLDAALRVAVDRLLDSWSSEPASVGFTDGAFVLVPGGHPLSTAALRIGEEVATAIEEGEVAVTDEP